jgi:hypothetical protein
MQASLASEAAKLHVIVDDAQAIVPPSRQYDDAEIKHDLKERGVDAILVVNIGDSGIEEHYVGTVLSGGFSGVESGTGTVNSYGGISTISYGGTVSGNSYAVASPIYRATVRRRFQPRLSTQIPAEPSGSETAKSKRVASYLSAMRQAPQELLQQSWKICKPNT